MAQQVKNPPAGDRGDASLIPGLGRSPGEGNGNPLQYSCLGNPMDRGAWWATVHGLHTVGHDAATKYTHNRRCSRVSLLIQSSFLLEQEKGYITEDYTLLTQ